MISSGHCGKGLSLVLSSPTIIATRERAAMLQLISSIPHQSVIHSEVHCETREGSFLADLLTVDGVVVGLWQVGVLRASGIGMELSLIDAMFIGAVRALGRQAQ